MNDLKAILSVVSDPYGLIATLSALLLLLNVNKSIGLIGWVSFSVLCFFASLGQLPEIYRRGEFIFPLSSLLEIGRSLAIMALIFLFFLALKTHKYRRKANINKVSLDDSFWDLTPKPLIYLLCFQVVIVIKTLIYGDYVFSLLIIVIFSTITYSFIYGPSVWLQNDSSFDRGVGAIAGAGFLFAIANFYQALFATDTLFLHRGWFHGTTSNPQHAGILILSVIPSVLFLLFQNKRSSVRRIFWFLAFILAIFALYLTASRTAMISALVAILLFFRRRLGHLFFILSLIAILYFLIEPSSYFEQNTLLDPTVTKITSAQNTRELVWSSLWSNFLQYPFFGVPLTNDRLSGFGESSWLGAASAVGILGLTPLLALAWSCLKMLLRLDQISSRNPETHWRCSVVISGLGSLLVGSLSEAYLLGNLTFPLFVILLYLMLGHYLIRTDHPRQIVL